MTGGFAAIDESSASDSDFAYGSNGGGNVLEVSLSDPPSSPGSGSYTVRFRLAEIAGGSLGDGNGNANPITVEVYEGATQRAATTRSPGGAWTTYTWTPDLSAVSDWNNLRLRFSDTANGGKPANRRAMGVSWAEVEVPAGLTPITGSLSAQEAGADVFAASGTVADPAIIGSLAAQEIGGDGFTASGAVDVSGALLVSEAGVDSFSAAGVVSLSGELAAQEVGTDGFSAGGSVLVQGALASQEVGFDGFTASGTVADAGLTGSLAAQETGADAPSASGGVLVGGLLASQEAGLDVLSSSGDALIEGTLTGQEAGGDSFTSTGSVDSGVTGSFSAQESGGDILSITGLVAVTGGLLSREVGADTFTGTSAALGGVLLVREPANDNFEASSRPNGFVGWSKPFIGHRGARG